MMKYKPTKKGINETTGHGIPMGSYHSGLLLPQLYNVTVTTYPIYKQYKEK